MHMTVLALSCGIFSVVKWGSAIRDEFILTYKMEVISVAEPIVDMG
ncbi:hypothetical protein [Rahnella ecdela]|uniref:Uncharacterized protein n=1 Tax=Rahnella ecdela TaxID=2816250 RepID=A0ABS6LD22_9GAMM|nr:hypothetical protein [Rahnella ecdela]MBU9844831.1 hypothetical protein [Rahnella ecdela]